MHRALIQQDSCPDGLVFPDDPDSPDNWYPNITLSNCTISCYNSPFFTVVEHHTLNIADMLSLAASIIFALVVLVLWLVDDIKKKQVFVLAYGAVIVVMFTVRLSAFFGGPTRHCRNNANIITGDDGITVCAIEGFCILYILLFCATCFSLQSFELFRRIVLGHRQLESLRVYIWTIIIVPATFALWALADGRYGSDFTTGFCRVVDTGESVDYVTFLPLAVATLTGIVFASSIVVKLLLLVFNSGVGIWDGAVLAGTSLQYLVFSGFYLCSLLILRSTIADNTHAGNNDRHIEQWGQCALLNFDGVTTESYTIPCGQHAHRSISFASLLFMTIWIRAGFGFFFVLVNFEGLLMLFRKHVFRRSISPVESSIGFKRGSRSRDRSLSHPYSIGDSG
mgnify:FL=1